MARRTNLVYNPSFRITTEGTTTVPDGWDAVFSVIEKSSTYAVEGDHSLKIIKSDNTQSGVATHSLISVMENLPYSASAYIRVPTDNEDATIVLSLRWFREDGTEIVGFTTTSDVKVLSFTEDWYRIYVIDTAPANAMYMKLYVTQTIAGTALEEFYVDSVLVEQAAYVGNYIENFTQGEETSVVTRSLTPEQLPTIGGMQLNADIALGTLVFNTIDEHNVVWVCTNIEGWWVHPDAQVPDITRGTQDGSYQVEGRYAARQLTLSGVFLPQSAADVTVARDMLISATNLARTGAWLKTSEEPTKAAYVRLAGRPQISTVNARGRTEFSIPLRAADPIKYLWNDENLDGLTEVDITGVEITGDAPNPGTASVAPQFKITGPLGTGSTIYNSRTEKTITVASPLRGARRIGAVSTAQIFNRVATLTTIEKHSLVVGDIIDVTGAGVEYDSTTDVPYTVSAVTTTAPFSVSYPLNSDDLIQTSKLGAYIKLRFDDVLLVDSYERSVSLNGSTSGNRAVLDTLIDWIELVPGDNPLQFTDNIDPSYAINKTFDSSTGVATLTTSTAHFLEPSEDIVISLDADAILKRKSLTANVATLTTSTPHGFSVGDLVDVEITVAAQVHTKKIVTEEAVLIVTPIADVNAFAAGDIVNIALPTVASVAFKSRATNVASIATQAPHGFSNGDSVAVTLPVNSAVFQKAVTSNVVELTTTAAHGYSVGDSVVVTLPITATATNKVITGTTVVVTTASAHGYGALDVVTVSFPVSATLAGTRSFGGYAGDYIVTLNTSAAHNFNVGDIISVNLDIATSRTVTNRVATTTACTLTLSDTHNYSVGELITVSGVGARYNGAYVISSVDVGNKTVTYLFSGSAESAIASTGTVVNNTIASGYNGTKVISTVPSGTSLTYFYYGHDNATSSTLFGGAKLLTNTTNTQLNGDYPVTIVNTTRFSYTKAGV
jgi:hypothetical protein